MVSLKERKTISYRKYIWLKWLTLFVMLGLLFITTVLSLAAGSAALSVPEIVSALFFRGTEQAQTIIWNVRMPRVATGIAVGFGLAMSGCIMQNVLRNPLASASTLGVSQGASFGAAVAIVFFEAGVQVGNTTANFTVTNPSMVSILSFVFGMATTLVILLISRVRRSNPATMVLAGVALSNIFAGMTTLIQYFVDDVKLASMVYWTFGSLSRAAWGEIALIAVVDVLAFLYFCYNRLNYNAMEAGTHTAKSLGVPVDRLVFFSMTLCALVTSISVAFAGTIGFIGLIGPHIMRKFVGNDYRFLIPCSALCGSTLLLLADIASRSILPPVVLPIGALTSFLGAPLFLYLCLKGVRKK
ncbi:MAG: FecCD family ABC transporter permease [Faecousia sp.]